MSAPESERALEEFEARLREWGTRPPKLASTIAANRIVGRVAERRPASSWRRLAAATAVVLVLVIAAWLGTPRRPAPPAAVATIGMESGDVVQFWLDAETPVYFVLPEFGQGKGESS